MVFRKNNILNRSFRDRRRPLDHILRLHDTVHKALNNQRSVLAVFLDIEKAYDLVCRNVLLLKLLNVGINGNMFNFIRYFLTNRSFRIRVSSTLSTVKSLKNGIPQGSVLSPLLFSVMINDLLLFR